MKTPEEWVENVYDGFSFNLERQIEMKASTAVEWVKNIQSEAYHEGQLAGLQLGKETAMKTISEVFSKTAEKSESV